MRSIKKQKRHFDFHERKTKRPVGLSEVHLQLLTTWRSGPEDRFCLAVRKSHLLLLSPPIKTQHTAEGKCSVNVEACVPVFGWVCVGEKEED